MKIQKTYIYGCPHTDCMYRQRYSGCCAYFMVEGVTRTFLHKDETGDINNPCQEYRPGVLPHSVALRVKTI